jgi:hypothetical protein
VVQVAEAVADMLFRFGADITELKAKLNEANARLNKLGAESKRGFGHVREGIEGLKSPLANVGRLTNALGELFGGAQTAAVKMVRELVEGIGTGSEVIIGLSLAAGLVSALVAKYREAAEAAKKAGEAAVKAQNDQQTAIRESIEALEKKNKISDAVIKGSTPTFEEAKTDQTTKQGVLDTAKSQFDQIQAEIVAKQEEIQKAKDEARTLGAGADKETRAGIQSFTESRIKALNSEILQLTIDRQGLATTVELAKHDLKEAAKATDTTALNEFSTVITPTTQTPVKSDSRDADQKLQAARALAGQLAQINIASATTESARAIAEYKNQVAQIELLDKVSRRKKDAAEVALAEELTKKLARIKSAADAQIRTATATTPASQAIAEYQNRIVAISQLEESSVEDRNAASEAEFQKLQDRLGQIEADRIERSLRDGSKARKEGNQEAAQDAQVLVAAGQQLADTVGTFVGSLVEGFSSIADFAKAAKGLVLGLIADLVKAVVVAGILSLLFGGSTVALTSIGGITGAVGRGLGFKGFAAGGSVGSTDTVPAMLTPGEYVMPADAVRHFGVDFMNRVRSAGRLGYADGGLVRGGAAASGGGTVNVIQAFDVPAIARNSQRLETVQTRRINNRQGALVKETLRRSLG